MTALPHCPQGARSTGAVYSASRPQPLGRAAQPGSIHSRGFTLLEILTALAVLALLATMALPAWAQWRARTGVAGVAHEFEALLQQARAHAWATGESVQLAFAAAGTGACLLVHTGERGACQCPAAPAVPAPAGSCAAGARLLQHAWWPAGAGVSVSANVSAMRLDALHGTVSPAGTVRVASPLGPALHQVVNVMGRVRTCVPAAAPAWSGVAPC
jgi:type IV fimbrial biogenesis protein FimT